VALPGVCVFQRAYAVQWPARQTANAILGRRSDIRHLPEGTVEIGHGLLGRALEGRDPGGFGPSC